VKSTRSKFVENVGCVDETTGFNIGVRFAKSLMERLAIGVVEPIAWVQGKKFHLRPLWWVSRLVDNESASLNASLESHANQATTARAAQQPLAADGCGRDDEPPRLKSRVRRHS